MMFTNQRTSWCFENFLHTLFTMRKQNLTSSPRVVQAESVRGDRGMLPAKIVHFPKWTILSCRKWDTIVRISWTTLSKLKRVFPILHPSQYPLQNTKGNRRGEKNENFPKSTATDLNLSTNKQVGKKREKIFLPLFKKHAENVANSV